MIRAKKDYFATEAALCAAFLAWVKREEGKFYRGAPVPKWTPYAETAGWDILLVGEDGTQIGIQAKLRLNWKVVDQTLPGGWDAWHDKGPDYRAVLVPEADEGAKKLLGCAGVMTIQCRYESGADEFQFEPGLDMEDWNGGWHYWSPKRREDLPEFVPDVVAGDSGPVQLTKWKIAALRVIARLEMQGHVTRADFKELQLDPRRWLGPNGWLTSAAPGQYVRGPHLDFDKQHPVVYAQVLAEARERHEKRKRDLIGDPA